MDKAELKELGADNQATWLSVLQFLCLELFDLKLFEEWARAIECSAAGPQKGEKVLQVVLLEYEKRLFLLSDVVKGYLQRNHARMIVSDVEEWSRAQDALRQLFWSLLHKNHDEVAGLSVGVRSNFQVVEVPNKPQAKIMAGTPPKGLIESLFGLPEGEE